MSELNQEMRAAATEIVRKLREAGFEAVFAGGCVRDQLRGVAAKDYDVATNATPTQVQGLFPKSEAIGAHFGVVMVKFRGFGIEIATFRADGVYSDGRHPDSVRFTTAEEDAQRRDFTVNGLFYDPIANQVIDYVGGQADLETKVIRAIGDPAARFREDHLRLMRAVRFATVLGFEIEGKTFAAIQHAAPMLAEMAIERVREEFVKIMLHPQRVRGLDLLDATGLLRVIIPEFEALKGCEQPPQFHPEGDVYVHTRLVLSNVPDEASLPLVLSALLHDIGKPATRTWDEAAQRIRFNEHDSVGATMTEQILRRLKFDNDTIEATVEAVAHHMHFMNVKGMRTAKLKRFMARPTFPDEMLLHRADCLGCHADLENYDFLKAKAEAFAAEPLIPPRLLTGNDLIALGLRPGPRFKILLEEAQTRQLEGALTTSEEAIAWAKEELAQE